MSSITIRDVPQEVRNELAARAARRGQSMQEYLKAELARLAAKPPIEEVLERARKRSESRGTHLTREQMLDALHADRP